MSAHFDDLSYCPNCASAWWIPVAMNINLDGKVTGYTYPVRCAECGHQRRPDGPIIGRVTGS